MHWPTSRRGGLPAEVLDARSFSARGLAGFLRLIRRHRIDIVHWNFTEAVANPYLWALKATAPRVQHWLTDHVSRLVVVPQRVAGLKRGIKSRLLARYARVIAVSGYVRECLEHGGFPQDVAVQYLFVNPARFARNALQRHDVRQREGVADKFVVLYVGQLIDEKGVDVALQAMAELPAHAVLWIVGSGKAQARLSALS